MRRSLKTLSYLRSCARQGAGATSSTGISCGCAQSMQHSFTSALHSSQATSPTCANNFHGRFNTGSTRSISSATATTSINRQALVNKLLYRSRQRGFLELDLMMGLWAEKELLRMSEEMLQHFTRVLDMENPDLFKWLTGQLPAPEEVASNPAYAALTAHVQQQLGHNSHQSSQAPSGREWVRGWDDMWKKQDVQDGTSAPTAGQQ